jgi:uncharacterized membrane protein YkvA (DUF1232 family)
VQDGDILEQLDLVARRLRIRVMGWLASERGRDHPAADRIAAVPDLFELVVRLQLEPNLSAPYRARLLAAVVYVVASDDFLPEAAPGVTAWVDDLVILAAVVRHGMTVLGVDMVRRHWGGSGEIDVLVADVASRARELLGDELAARLRPWMGGSAARA